MCDLDDARAQRAAALFNAAAYTDFAELLRVPSVDAVALLLPHTLHYPFARKALEAGKHVIVEKPFTVRELEADDLITLAADRGLTLAVSENSRFVRAYIALERLVRTGALGTIRFFRGFIPDQVLPELEAAEWKRQALGAAAIIDAAPHMLYLLKWLFGNVECLQAFGRSFVPHLELENHAVVAGRLLNGILFSVEICSVTEYPRGERVEIFGSEGTLIVDQVLNPPVVLYRGERDLRGTPIGEAPYEIQTWKAESIAAATHDFVDSILDHRPPAVNLDDATYAVRLVECAYESIERGGRVVDVENRVARSTSLAGTGGCRDDRVQQPSGEAAASSCLKHPQMPDPE